jgi:predicted nucleotidyltransferase
MHPLSTAELSAICRTHRVARLVLFSSRAQGTAHPGSAANVLVQFAGTDGLFSVVTCTESDRSICEIRG